MADLDLLYQCQWCDNAAVAEGFCGPCGSKSAKCRAPKYSRIRVQMGSTAHTPWNTTLFTTSVGCCGQWAGGFSYSPTDYPLLQWGYHRHYRFRLLEKFYNSRQDVSTPLAQAHNEVNSREFHTFRTNSASAIWHYWFRLNSYSVKMYPILQYGICRIRVVVTIDGTHYVSQVIRVRNDDGRTNPTNACHQVFLNALTGVAFGQDFITQSCLDTLERGPACPGLFLGTNPHTLIMPWRAEQSLGLEPPSTLPTEYSHRQTWCKDFDKLPDDILALDDFTTTGCTPGPCSALGSLIQSVPAFSWPTWNTGTTNTPLNVNTSGGYSAPRTPNAGASPFGNCTPPTGFFTRNYIQRSEATLEEEAMPGSSPRTSPPTPNLGQWTIKFLQV
jgi:hypothetical protein